MSPRALLAPALALLILWSAGSAWAQPQRSASTLDPNVSVEWEVGQDKRGRPIISGYVHNAGGRIVGDVRLEVQVLDAGGQVTRRAVVYVDQPVPQFGRTYFEARLPAPGPRYQVTVLHFSYTAGGPSS